MNTCRLDTLPVELVHHLLGYFSAHEIFYTFTNVTSYIDAVLAAYTNYRVNFQAITRPNFHLVCQHMKPEQVIALTLSDDEDTPGLIGVFLSRFNIHQFTRLQALKFIEIGADFWESIIIPMTTLKYLRSFSFFSTGHDARWVCNLSEDSVIQLDKVLSDSYTPILPQLYQLRLNHSDFLNSIQFPHLRHLVLGRSTVDLMKHISVAAPQLQSLDTLFSLDALPTELIYPMAQLNCLILTIDDFEVSMDILERMISNLPRLKRLELSASCDDYVVDGHRWRMKVENLVTFKFKFNLSYKLESQQLDSFRTSFWVKQKQWFVAFTHRVFFSVPHFIGGKVDEDFRLPLHTTAPEKEIFYRCIDTLQVTEELSSENIYFPHVRTLALYSVLSVFTIEKVVDLRQIQRLVLFIVREDVSLKSLIDQMPNLCRISIQNNVEIFLQQVLSETLKKIRTLQIGNSSIDVINYNIEHLCTAFPNITHLRVNDLCSITHIFDLLDRFKHLSTASFRYLSFYRLEDQEHIRLDIQSTLDQRRRVQGLNYTYRFDPPSVYFWI